MNQRLALISCLSCLLASIYWDVGDRKAFIPAAGGAIICASMAIVSKERTYQ